MSRVVVVGGGASGVVAAYFASKKNDVTLLEGNDKLLKKLLLTGNGRCNYWNSLIDVSKYETDNIEMLSKIISFDNQKKVTDFFDSIGIFPKIKDGYYYPYSNQATSMREIFIRVLDGVNVVTNFKVKDIIKKENQFIIYSTNNESIICDKVIVSTGSKAMPKTGSDGSGYDILSSLGHSVNKVLPALTSLVVSNSFKDCENVRCRAKVSVYLDGNHIKDEVGEVLLKANAVSGICVFNVSSIVSKNIKRSKVYLNFLPDILDLYSFFEERNRTLSNLTIMEQLESLFNYKLLFVILKKACIDKNIRWSSLNDSDKKRLVSTISNFSLDVIGVDDFSKAQVCTGGVSLNEINETMESKIVKDLYVTGEVLDVDGICGGYNLVFAFISGYLAGVNV